jgi:hypothetical protein
MIGASALLASGCSNGAPDPGPAIEDDILPPPRLSDSPPRPVRVPSFGPNGTHWPDDTPWLHDVVPHVLDVECTWAAIRRALESVTPEWAAEGVHIRVEPGVLVGSGGGSSGSPVLRELGLADWGRRVLVLPRDGYGSVRLTGGVRFHRVDGVAFALLYGDQVTLSACRRTALCWSSLDGWIVQASAGGPGSIAEMCDLYEVVVDRTRLQSSDPTGLGSGYTKNTGGPADGNGMLRNCLLEGCYTAPRWRVAGDSDHVDTCQTYTGGGLMYGFTFRDTAVWGSNNCALQASGLTPELARYLPAEAGVHITLDHALLVGPATTQATRYPALPGGTPVAGNQAINGAGGVLGMIAHDSIIAGSIYPSTWREVTNTLIPKERPSAVVSRGGWTVDGSLFTPDSDRFDGICPKPSEAFLKQIWR